MPEFSPSDSLEPDLTDLGAARDDADDTSAYDALAASLAPQGGIRGAATQAPAEQRGEHKASGSAEPSPPVFPSVFQFMAQLPGRSIVGGVRDASQEMLNSLYEWDTWAMSAADVLLPGPGIAAVQEQAGAPKLPEVPEPDTAGGKMVRGVTQFLTGFLPANRLIGGASTMNAVARGLLAGAIADGTAFDPHQQRLSNLIQEHPALQNPVTEYLQAKPSDSRAMGRLKSAVEGLGLGLAGEGLVRSLSVLRAARNARGSHSASLPPPGPATVAAGAFNPLGDVKAPLTVPVDVTDAIRKKLKRAAYDSEDTLPGMLLEAPGNKGIYINLTKIDTAEDVRSVIQQAADLHAGSIDEARRGVQSMEETQRLADDLGLSLMDVLLRNKGEAFNAETAVAARGLLNASGAKLTELATLASSTKGSKEALFNFRRAMTIHQAIQKEVISARTETARALNSWKIPVGVGEEQARGIQALLDAHGGDALSADFAKRIAKASQAGLLTPQGINALVNKGVYATTRNAVLEAFTMGLLSGPQTHVVNALSNVGVIAQAITERQVAGKYRSLIGGTGVEDGEAAAQLIGMIEGQKDIFRWASKHLRAEINDFGMTEVPPLISEPLLLGNKLEGSARAISAENFRLMPDSMAGATVDGIGALIGAPGKLLEASDAVFKTLGYRMELHALAFRQARQEGLQGPALKARQWELAQNPPDSLRMESIDAALYQTFQTPSGPFTEWVQRGLAKAPVARFIVPFVRTPANILKYTFERTPLAPLMSQWRADIAAGGARRDIALTRMGMGTAAMLTAMDMTMSGNLTGGGHPNRSVNEARERQGIPRYSIKVGDRWVQYNRLDPGGSTLGMAADFAEFMNWRGEVDSEDMEARGVWAAMVASTASNLMNKQYLGHFASTIEAVSDPRQYGPEFVKRMAGSFVPTGIAAIEKVQDPTIRATYGMLDAMKARTPGWGKDLPPSRDLWGKERTVASGLGWGYDATMPLPSKREMYSPVDIEIERLGMPVEMPSKIISYGGLPVDLRTRPWLYDRYVVLAGAAKKDLDLMVTGKSSGSGAYRAASDGADGVKAQMIAGVIRAHREMARVKLYQESAELRAEVRRKAKQKGIAPP